MTAMVVVEQVTRDDVVAAAVVGQHQRDLPGLRGTVTCPSASVVVTPPLLPVPPVPAGPETM